MMQNRDAVTEIEVAAKSLIADNNKSAALPFTHEENEELIDITDKHSSDEVYGATERQSVGSKKRGVGYSHEETISLIKNIDSIIPTNPYEWRQVHNNHVAAWPLTMRDKKSVREKFSKLCHLKYSTHDPSCPPEIQSARAVQQKILIKIQNSEHVQGFKGNGKTTKNRASEIYQEDDVSTNLRAERNFILKLERQHSDVQKSLEIETSVYESNDTSMTFKRQRVENVKYEEAIDCDENSGYGCKDCVNNHALLKIIKISMVSLERERNEFLNEKNEYVIMREREREEMRKEMQDFLLARAKEREEDRTRQSRFEELFLQTMHTFMATVRANANATTSADKNSD